MTDENFEFLSKYSKCYKTAETSNYSSAIPTKDLLKMDEIYKEEKGNSIKPKNFSCPSCNLTFLKKIGKLWNEENEIRLGQDSNLD